MAEIDRIAKNVFLRCKSSHCNQWLCRYDWKLELMTVDGQLVSSKKTLTLPVMVNVNFLIVFITRVIVT